MMFIYIKYEQTTNIVDLILTLKKTKILCLMFALNCKQTTRIASFRFTLKMNRQPGLSVRDLQWKETDSQDCLFEIYIKEEQTTRIVCLRFTLKMNRQPGLSVWDLQWKETDSQDCLSEIYIKEEQTTRIVCLMLTLNMSRQQGLSVWDLH